MILTRPLSITGRLTLGFLARIRRATLFAVGGRLSAKLPEFRGRPEEIVADTAHIVGEAHGDWANRAWCEHRIA